MHSLRYDEHVDLSQIRIPNIQKTNICSIHRLLAILSIRIAFKERKNKILFKYFEFKREFYFILSKQGLFNSSR